MLKVIQTGYPKIYKDLFTDPVYWDASKKDTEKEDMDEVNKEEFVAPLQQPGHHLAVQLLLDQLQHGHCVGVLQQHRAGALPALLQRQGPSKNLAEERAVVGSGWTAGRLVLVQH